MTTMSKKDSLRSRLISRLLRWGIGHENEAGDYFVTFHHRPKRNDQIGTWPDPDCGTAGCAIVMQGPIAKEHAFTVETLRLYRRTMPDATLILSTWEDEDPQSLARISDLGVTVVKNRKPALAGLSNINMQIVSASAGMRHAAGLGARWIMKTRTDQRLYEPNVLPFLIGIAEAFPVGGDTPQRNRIIGIGHGSLKFAPYHVTDQTLFGDAQDMLAYWSPPLQDEAVMARWPEGREATYLNHSIAALIRETVPEAYLASRFLMQMGRNLDWTIADSWAAYRDHFCFVDYGTTDFFWLKTQTYTGREYTRSYETMVIRREMNFLEWMLLYSGQLQPDHAARFEGILQDRFFGTVPPPRL